MALFIKLGKLLNTRAVFFDRSMTSHAFRCRRQPHIVTRFWHFVAVLALQPNGQVLPVAIWNRLGRTRRRVLQGSRLSCQSQRDRKEHEEAPQHENVVSHRPWCITDGSLFAQISLSRMSSGLGALAVLLACTGLYGLMAYSVARRTNEIGTRMALGADRGDLIRMILRETFWLVLIGIAVGLAGSRALTRIISNLFFGVTTTDLTTISLATALLLAVALFAGYLPARRASPPGSYGCAAL